MVAALRTGRRQDAAHRRYWRALAERTCGPPGGAGAGFAPDESPDGGQHLLYVALGDSAGVGLGVDDPAQSYVALVAARLAAARRAPVRVVNLAVSGATVASVVSEQLPLLDRLPAPDLVSCVVGGNDVAWPLRFRGEDRATDVDRLVGGLPAGAVLGLVPSFGHWPYEGRARRLNRILEAAARARGLRVADLWGPTRERWPWGALGLLGSDHFHPGVEGHRVWARAVWAAVEVGAAPGR